MPATPAQIAQLRRLVAEPTPATYPDAALAAAIETYPRLDAAGRAPGDPGWAATYDLNAAAASVWDEKAAALAAAYDFSADGATHHLSQQHAQALRQARHCRARRSPGTLTLRPEPRPKDPHADEC